MGTHDGPRRAPRGVREVEAAAAATAPRREHARHRLERPRGHRDQRRDLPPAGRLGLGDPDRGPLPRHPPPRRRHVAIPPPRRGVRAVARYRGPRPSRTASSTSPMTHVIARDRLVAVELPVGDQPLVRRRRSTARRASPPRAGGRLPATAPRVPRPRRAARRAGAGSPRPGSDRARSAARAGTTTRDSKIRAVTSATSSRRSLLEVDAGLLLEAVHHRVAQRALVARSAGRPCAR